MTDRPMSKLARRQARLYPFLIAVLLVASATVPAWSR